jgi:hypothetical protein
VSAWTPPRAKEPSTVRRPGRYGGACRWCPHFSYVVVSAASQLSPVSTPRDVKSIDAEAIKPNWPVASHMSQLFTNQHTRHVRKSAGRRSAGQGCPAPVGQNQLARGVLYDTKVYQSIYSPRAILMLHGGTPAGEWFFSHGRETMTEQLVSSAVRRPGRYWGACRRCPHRATLSHVILQNLAYNTKQRPLRSGDRGDVVGCMSPVSSPRDVKHFEITKFSL